MSVNSGIRLHKFHCIFLFYSDFFIVDSSQMSSLVMCLRRAKVLGLLDKQLESPQNVNALINISVLQEALCHIDEQVMTELYIIGD